MTLFILDPTEELKMQFEKEDTVVLETVFLHRLSTLEKYNMMRPGDSLLLDMENSEWKDTDSSLQKFTTDKGYTFTTSFEEVNSRIFKVGNPIDMNVLYATLLGRLKYKDVFLDTGFNKKTALEKQLERSTRELPEEIKNPKPKNIESPKPKKDKTEQKQLKKDLLEKAEVEQIRESITDKKDDEIIKDVTPTETFEEIVIPKDETLVDDGTNKESKKSVKEVKKLKTPNTPKSKKESKQTESVKAKKEVKAKVNTDEEIKTNVDIKEEKSEVKPESKANPKKKQKKTKKRQVNLNSIAEDEFDEFEEVKEKTIPETEVSEAEPKTKSKKTPKTKVEATPKLVDTDFSEFEEIMIPNKKGDSTNKTSTAEKVEEFDDSDFKTVEIPDTPEETSLNLDEFDVVELGKEESDIIADTKKAMSPPKTKEVKFSREEPKPGEVQFIETKPKSKEKITKENKATDMATLIAQMKKDKK